MSTGQASRASVLTSASFLWRMWRKPTAFRHSCARSSKRTVRLISGVALDQCRVPERYRTRAPFCPRSSMHRADASHASGRRRESFCPHHFCPCGVVQSTCLPLMQEITGAKPVRDAILSARGSRVLRIRQPWMCFAARKSEPSRFWEAILQELGSPPVLRPTNLAWTRTEHVVLVRR